MISAPDPQQPNHLKMPAQKVDATEAYIRAVIEIPDMLDDIAASLAMIALYCEKHGLAAGILSPDDIPGSNGTD